ncbi:MAG: HEAT repeat domain-containing protein [Prochlorothrix sp.]
MARSSLSSSAPSPATCSPPPPDRSTLDPLIQQLQQGDFQARWSAMKALVKLGDVAIDPLLACLHDRGFETWDDEEEDEDLWEFPWFIAQILGQIQHPRAIEALVELVRHYAPQTESPDLPASLDVAQVAAAALAQLGAPALPALQAMIAHPETRSYGVHALAQMQDPQVVDLLIGAAQDDDAAVRAIAMEALAGFLEDRIAPVFVQGLKDVSAQVRQRAIAGVGLRATASEVPQLLQALQPLLWDVNLGVACQAAIALGRLGQPAAVSMLVEVLEQPTAPALQDAALQSLCGLGTDTAFWAIDRHIQTALLAPPDRTHASLRTLLAYLGQLTLPASQLRGCHLLTRFLAQTCHQEQHSPLKQVAANSLGQLGHKLNTASPTDLEADLCAAVGAEVDPAVGAAADTEARLELSTDPDPDFQLASSPGHSPEPGRSDPPHPLRTIVIEPLIQLLADSDPGVRFHAIAALKHCNAPLALQCLQAWHQATPPHPLPSEALQAGITCALAEWHR